MVEYVEQDNQLAINEMVSVCKNAGVVFVTVPTFMDLWSKHDEINYQFKQYTTKTLLPLFSFNKGTITYHSYFNTFLFIPIYSYLFLFIPIYSYLFLFIPIYSYLFLFIPIYSYLYGKVVK